LKYGCANVPVPYPTKPISVAPTTTCTKEDLPNSWRTTARSGGGDASSAGRKRSLSPLGGSRTISLNTTASITPGKPTTTNAQRQPSSSAIQPPLIAPNIVPRGIPSE
jgi:hypothetical protein